MKTLAKRKIQYVQGDATVMVPVTVRWSMTLESASVADAKVAAKAILAGKTSRKAEVISELEVIRILDVNGYDDGTSLRDLIQEVVEDSKIEVGEWSVSSKPMKIAKQEGYQCFDENGFIIDEDEDYEDEE